MNLTKMQLETLKELAQHECKAHYMPYMGSFRSSAYWFLSSNHKKCTKQIEKLIGLGFVKRVQKDWSHSEAFITKKGREKINAIEQVNKKKVPANLANGTKKGIP